MHETAHIKEKAQTGPSEVEKASKQLWQNPEMQSLVINVATEVPVNTGSAPQIPG